MVEKFRIISGYGLKIKGVQSAINAEDGVGKDVFSSITKEEQIINLYEGSKESSPDSVYIKGSSRLIGDYDTVPNGGVPKRHINSNGDETTVYIKPTTIAGFSSVYGVFTNNSLWSNEKLFPYSTPVVKKMFDQMEVLTKVSEDASTDSKADKRKALFSSFKRYLNSSVFSDNVDADRQRLIFDDDTSLAKTLKKIKDKKMLSNNAFVNRLEHNIRKGKLSSKVIYDAGSAENINENNIHRDFLDLVTNVQPLWEGYTTYDLANDLVNYSYLDGGIQQAVEFVKYVPASYLKEGGFMEKMQNVNWENETSLGLKKSGAYYNPEDFFIQHIQNNPSEVPTVEATDLSKYKIGASEIVLNKERISSFTTVLKNGDVEPAPFLAIGNFNAPNNYDLYQRQKGEIGFVYKKIDSLEKEYNDSNPNGEAITTMGTQITNVVPTRKTEEVLPGSEWDNINAQMQEASEQQFNPYDSPIHPDDSHTVEGMDLLVNASKIINTEKTDEKVNLAGRTPSEILENILTTSNNPMNKYLAKEYLSQMDSLDVTIRSNNNLPAKGRASIINNKDGSRSYLIEINQKQILGKSDFEHTLLHEMTHQVTREAVYRGTNPEARQKLVGYQAMFERQVRRDFESGRIDPKSSLGEYLNYMIGDFGDYDLDENQKLQEFTGFAMSNPEVQSYLKGIEFQGTQSMWDKLIAAWKDLLVSMGVTDVNNLLSATMESVLEISEGNKKVNKNDYLTERTGTFENRFDEAVALALQEDAISDSFAESQFMDSIRSEAKVAEHNNLIEPKSPRELARTIEKFKNCML
jgi:hypothetical protein